MTMVSWLYADARLELLLADPQKTLTQAVLRNDPTIGEMLNIPSSFSISITKDDKKKEAIVRYF